MANMELNDMEIIIDFGKEYQQLFMSIIYIAIVLPMLMLFSVWCTPWHKFKYEEHDKLDKAHTKEEKEKVIHVRRSINIATFLMTTYCTITSISFLILFLEYANDTVSGGYVKKALDCIMTFEGIILPICLFFTGIINEKTYTFFTDRLGYGDNISKDEKKFALYTVTFIVSIILLNKKIFILLLAIFVGKFVWIDTYLDLDKKLTMIEICKRLKDKILGNHVNLEATRFCAAIATSNVGRIIFSLIQSDNAMVLYLSTIFQILIIIMWYIIPYLKNIKGTIDSIKKIDDRLKKD